MATKTDGIAQTGKNLLFSDPPMRHKVSLSRFIYEKMKSSSSSGVVVRSYNFRVTERFGAVSQCRNKQEIEK